MASLSCRNLYVWSLAALAALSVVTPLGACDTPVYRYAMYRWAPTPYEVYFFHDKPATPADEAVRGVLEKAAQAEESPANVLYFPVDLSQDTALDTLPPDVRKAWSAEPDAKLPVYFVSTPHGVEVFRGEMDESSASQLVDSAARRTLAKLLQAGNAGVFIILNGPNAERNKEVEKDVQGVIASAAAGDLTLYGGPLAKPEGEAQGPKLDIGRMTVDRDDLQEQWLVRMLLSVEDDLAELDEPMVFVAYGRARALPPYVGRGINRDNLIECIEFITGACSCTIKEQNPGVDLLVTYDWETAAAAVADKYGAEEGNETQFGGDDFFPELIIPTAGPEEGVTATEGAEPAETANDDESVTEDEVDVSEPSAPAADAETATQTAAAVAVMESEPEVLVTSWSALAVVGGGLIVALVVLFATTFLVLRPR